MKKRRVVPGIVCGIVGLTFAGGGTGPLLVGCSSDPNREAGQDEELFEPDIPVGEPGSLFDGHPGNETLPDDNKADAVYPAKFAGPAEWDSPVKNQGKRSICSIFATTALMENLYRKSGILNDPDFSEQYLQWSVKYEMDRFADSPGSNFAVNLETIAKNGIVTEDVLPYEDRQWGTSNDPACTGQEGPSGQPTYCYTNGQPSAQVLAAKKWKLPPGRWINTNSIKAHMITEGTGVAVALELYKHSWHFHRGNRAQWSQGFVTYPNDQDKVESNKQPAGHAVLLVGWDDDLEVQLRDYSTGRLLHDSDGKPITEKGFYIFKNSWGTDNFGVSNPYGRGYGYISMAYVKEFGIAYVSSVPQPEMMREVCNDAEDNDGDGTVDCEDPDCKDDPTCRPQVTSHTFSNNQQIAIPDSTTTGITSIITVPEGGTIAGLAVTPDMDHTYSGDLEVTLVHGTNSAVLHRKGEDGSRDWVNRSYRPETFTGIDMAGEWKLVVRDLGYGDTGTLRGWTLEILTN